MLSASVRVDIGAPFLFQKLEEAGKIGGWEIVDSFSDGLYLIVKLRGKVKLKVTFTFVAYKGVYFGIDIKRVLVEGQLSIGGKVLDLVMPIFKKWIELSWGPAQLKVDGSTIYLENVKTDDIAVDNGRVRGTLFVDL